ncbi:hypothetical protein A6764_12090 [Brevibacillus sp. WF146]|uniref:hypothetical protein n=1 Tax=Brevibacillus sp. WF146 TaxID=319501 RepID=UPI000A57D286|nr:hypothetical protein [Brevibacillus sp. WF146]UYZ11604.1 hypothetical protein A6764_12090 [Brevibacillus sp. WF146]
MSEINKTVRTVANLLQLFLDRRQLSLSETVEHSGHPNTSVHGLGWRKPTGGYRR